MNLYTWVVMAMSTFPRDLKMSYDYMETMSLVNYWKWNNYKVYQLFDEVAKDYPQKTAFRLGYETWTFHMLQEYSQQIANYFHTAGLQKGDVVAQAGVAGPRGVGLWLGLSRLGVATAILPSDLSPESMVQVAKSVFSKAIICNPKLVQDLKQQTLPDYMTLFSTEPTQDKTVTDLRKELAGVSSKPLKGVKELTVYEKLLYLFSPDTLTPIPVTNYRYAFIATALRKTLDLTDKDILYSPIPESRPEGSIVGTGQAVIFGNSVVSRGEFAANNYFPNCDHYDAMVALYTEGMVTDLLSLPPSKADTKHKVRLAVGKGLRNPETWTQFKDRFKIDRIGEYFGSVNSENYNMGERGILIDPLPKDDSSKLFLKNKPVIKDVFKKGDAYINTGDILMKDEQGYFYAVDTVADLKRRNGLTRDSESSSQTKDTGETIKKTHESQMEDTRITDLSNTESQKESVHTKNVQETQTPQEPTVSTDQETEFIEGDSSEPVLGHQSIDDSEESHREQPPAQEPTPEPEKSQQLQTEALPKPKAEPQPEPPAVYYNVEEKFQEAAAAVKEKDRELAYNDKLIFYGLYKQATLGNAKIIDKPGYFASSDDKAKWDAWNANNNQISRKQAMKNYREKAESLGLI